MVLHPNAEKIMIEGILRILFFVALYPVLLMVLGAVVGIILAFTKWK